MLDQLLSDSTAAETLTFSGTLSVIGAALGLGLFISLVYLFTHRREEYSASFPVTLIMLPVIIAMIILLVGNNVARAFSLAGAFSLIRFRSAPGDPKDISYVFFTLGVGLACGMGYIGYAAIFAMILCGVMVILTAVRFGSRRTGPMQLKILMPENMEYMGVFDGILNQYAAACKLVKVKTAEFGSVFELTYELVLNDLDQSKALIDELRCKNGNLNVILAARDRAEATSF